MSEFDQQSFAKRDLSKIYDASFTSNDSYRDTLPDPQNTEAPFGLNTDVEVKHVGISNFKLPLKIRVADGSAQTVEASMIGTVPCASGRRGINMGRIMRVFYRYRDQVFTPQLLESVLKDYCEELSADSARLKISFSYPMILPALRSGLEGYQFYKCSYEGRYSRDKGCELRVEFDFVYSSACPCSADLSEHAEDTREAYAVPHSQRSKARVWSVIESGHSLTLEDLQAICVEALKTETQVMVRREDEQAFAELNGANLKFVEDAARLLHQGLDAHPSIADFQVACAHLESLHSHDAVAVMVKGIDGGYDGDFDAFQDLIV
ncbi:MAG: GTP cyclohydrolase FolE2 [Opitutales bacterium]